VLIVNSTFPGKVFRSAAFKPAPFTIIVKSAAPAEQNHVTPFSFMASNPNYVKKQLTVDTVSWTAIVAPIDCMGVGIKNSAVVDLRIRTDSGDATTQDTIPAGSVETISAPRHGGGLQDGGSGTRFYAGDTIAYLQAASGTGPAQLTFVR
jgi:hypothetical protein